MTTPEGRAIYTGGYWQYEFDIKDHLGNTRVSFKAENGQLIQTAKTDFDPLGLVLKNVSSTNSVQNRFEFQGKESEQTFSLNRINLGARSYNATIGRMDRVDALADIMQNYTPYHSNFNNPLRFADPDGNAPDDFTYSDGYGNLSEKNITGNVAFSGFSTTGSREGDGGEKPKPKPKAQTQNTQKKDKFEDLAMGTLAAISYDVSIIDPSDAYLPKWVIEATVATAAVTYLYSAKYWEKLKASLDPKGFYYVTYTKTNAAGKVYVGRSSGYGTPDQVVRSRDYNHHMDVQGYGKAVLSTFAPATIDGGYGKRYVDPAYWSIRGSEQIQIEAYRNLGLSGNDRNGISPSHKFVEQFMEYGKKLLR